MFRKFLTASVLTLATASLFAADTYTIDKAHSSATFKVRHLISKVPGRFTDVGGTINLDKAKPENSTVEFTIQVASVNTNIEARDNHLKSPDFFDAQKYPTITFKSTKIVPAGGNKYNVTGNFTMKGVTKVLTIPVEYNGTAKDPWGNERAGFELATTLNRKDFNILWNKSLDEGGYLLGDDVEVAIAIEAVKEQPKAAPAAK